MDDLLADRTEHEAREAAAASVADHDQVGLPRFLEQQLGGLSFRGRAFGLTVGVEPRDVIKGVLHDALRVGAERLERLLVERGPEAAAVCRRWDFPHADDSQPRPAEDCLLGGELQRSLRRCGAVDSDDDRVHDCSLRRSDHTATLSLRGPRRIRGLTDVDLSGTEHVRDEMSTQGAVGSDLPFQLAAQLTALVLVSDLREIAAKRELYRRLARTSDDLRDVAERVWYSVLKES